MTHIYSMQRKQWIDLGRGLCMSAIIFFHTEIYYCGSEVVPYSVFAQNAITLFFFLSGYLFCSDREYSLHDKLAYILRRLVVPYFLFTIPISIMALRCFSSASGTRMPKRAMPKPSTP